MRGISNGILFSFLAMALFGCFDEPQYPDTPIIAFKDIVFRVTPEVSVKDTLRLYIDFKDGNGDLGLDANDPADLSDPYNNSTFFQEDGNGGLVPIASIDVNGNDANHNQTTYSVLEINDNAGALVTYRTRTKPGYASKLPAFDGSKIGCLNYLNTAIVVPAVYGNLIDPSHIIDTLEDQLIPPRQFYLVDDTLYFEPNDNHYNITVQFMVQDSQGTGFTEFDWRKTLCTTFDGRFPLLADDNSGSPLEGTIRYDMESVGFIPLFGNKRMKLRVYIKDRALHKSNVIETPEFNLAKIRQ